MLYKVILQITYNVLSRLLKQDQNKVVIALYREGKLEGNLHFIYEELLEQFPQLEVHFVYSENKMNLKLFKEIVQLSNAKYVIIDDYYLPVYLLKPKAKLKIIQLWHAAGAFKKFGHSTADTKFGPSKEYLRLVPVHANYTHVYISAAKFTDYYAEAFHMTPANIYPFGIPRVDLFTDEPLCREIKKVLYQEYNFSDTDNKINILVAPTYRAEGLYTESTADLMDTIIKLSKSLDKDIRILFKPHPYVKSSEMDRLRDCPNVMIATGHTINEWMLVSDAFITDYSSAIFEFALLKKPLAHYIPDYKEYQSNRGFYQEIEIMSDGTILWNEAELLDWMNARKQNEYYNTTRMIEYNFDDIENISHKIVKHFTS